MTDTKTGNVSKSYNQDRIKKSHVDYNANTLVTTFKNEAGQEMSVEWQVSDNDVAFRYIIPRQKGGETGSLVMEKEATGFKFPPTLLRSSPPEPRNDRMEAHQAKLRGAL